MYNDKYYVFGEYFFYPNLKVFKQQKFKIIFKKFGWQAVESLKLLQYSPKNGIYMHVQVYMRTTNVTQSPLYMHLVPNLFSKNFGFAIF